MGTSRDVRRRRALARAVAGAVVLAGLAVPLSVPSAASAHVVPEESVALSPEPTAADRAARLLNRRVRQRERALTQLTRRAAHYEDVKEAEVNRLAALGHTGDLADLTHVLPLADYALSATYGLAGPQWEDTHTGLDFAAPLGTPLVAIGDGAVTSVGDSGAYGLRTVVTLHDGTELWYCHQLSASVEAGEDVEVGRPIGAVGSTGNSTGPHLHLEVRPVGAGPVDPMAWFEALALTP